MITTLQFVKRFTILALLGTALISVNIFAKKETPDPQPILTLNCQQHNYQFTGGDAILNTAGPAQQLYLIHNASDKTLILNHLPKDPGASAGWASELKPNQWSAIAMSEGKFSLNCIIGSTENYVQNADCHKVLSICDMPHAVFPRLNLGSYWIIENQEFSSVLAGIKKRGIKVKLPQKKKNKTTAAGKKNAKRPSENKSI